MPSSSACFARGICTVQFLNPASDVDYHTLLMNRHMASLKSSSILSPCEIEPSLGRLHFVVSRGDGFLRMEG